MSPLPQLPPCFTVAAEEKEEREKTAKEKEEKMQKKNFVWKRIFLKIQFQKYISYVSEILFRKSHCTNFVPEILFGKSQKFLPKNFHNSEITFLENKMFILKV